MQGSRNNITEENTSWDRADVAAFLDEGRPKDKDGKPDRTKKSKKNPDDVRKWFKGKGAKDEEVEKLLGDLASYE